MHPGGDDGGGDPSEPNVLIRPNGANGLIGGLIGEQQQPSYRTLDTGVPSADASTSINSTNEQSLPGGSGLDRGANGNIPGGSLFGSLFRRKPDKAPLLSTSGGEGGVGSAGRRSENGGEGGPSTSDLTSGGRRDGLSTFAGVFCPVAMSMFSVLLFLRMGFVVGQSGILLALGQVFLAYAIILFTVFSMCAVSTNGAIEGGGVYYMISRALGPEFGGSIGVLFFLANVFSSALYISGFTETLMNNFGIGGYMVGDGPSAGLPIGDGFQFLYGVTVSLLLLVVVLVGASLFASSSVIMLGVVAVCYSTFLVSIVVKNQPFPVEIPKENDYVGHHNVSSLDNITFMYTGFRLETLRENLFANYTMDYNTGLPATFATVFAIVFSGVTGIMAGANMSGELKHPNVSIPRGTLQAVFLTLVVYCATALLLGGCCSRDLLVNNNMVMLNINMWRGFILIAIFSTTLFACMSNIIGASRVLSRLAEDRLFGRLFHPFTLKLAGTNPVICVLFSWILAMCVLVIGSLNKIAQITSIFFLLSYMGVNLACLALDLASAPNFRPQFKFFNCFTALAGCMGALAMMFVIGPIMSAVSIIVLLLLLMLLHYQAPAATWGSISQALMFHQVRKYLLLLDSRKEHVKYWRPQILLLVASPKNSCPLMDFVNDLKKSGLYVIGHVRRASMDDFATDPLHEMQPYWLSLVDYLRIKAFVELTVASSIRDGIHQLTRLSGVGAMKPNTVILGFPDDTAPENTLDTMRMLKELKHSKLDREEVVEYFTADDFPSERMSEALAGSNCPLSVSDYVSVIHDILKMNKNICLARHFHKLDKEAIFHTTNDVSRGGGNGGRRFVDVWPVDLMKPNEFGWGWDNSCLFLLQLACILSMVHTWKHKTTLRVFLCVTSMQDMQRRQRQLQMMLDQLRITGKSLVVPWDHVIIHLRKNADNNEEGEDDTSMSPRSSADLPESYVAAMNEMIRRHSENTAVVFFNMPSPPAQESDYEAYMKTLARLTDGLPPTLLVHGLASVISTAL